MAFTGRRTERPAMQERRAFLGTALKAAAGAASAAMLEPILGCTPDFFPRAPETVIYLENNHANISAQELGFRPGETAPDEAVRIMEGRGLTHVVRDTNANDGSTVDAITADYQHCIHIFRDGKYEQSVELDIARGEQPHRYAARVADYDGKKMILVLIRDATKDLEGFCIEPPRMALIPYDGGTVGEVKYSQLRGLERQQDGMQYPLFVGYDLDAGITFIARDKQGVPWDQGFIITWDGERLRGHPVPFFELVRCDCVGEWARRSGPDD